MGEYGRWPHCKSIRYTSAILPDWLFECYVWRMHYCDDSYDAELATASLDIGYGGAPLMVQCTYLEKTYKKMCWVRRWMHGG
jgi:hypothetical protein